MISELGPSSSDLSVPLPPSGDDHLASKDRRYKSACRDERRNIVGRSPTAERL